MKKTVFITGASSGIGRATSLYFAQQGWNVAASMRNPASDTALNNIEGLKKYKLDVLDEASIQSALQAALNDFGSLDAVVNNAGYAVVGAFEAATPEQIKRQFETNVFGVMNVTRAILPHFRSKRNGHIINITSMGGRITFPIYSIYHSTKWAVEGFAESLQFELKPLNIKVKNIEPGAIKTDFYDRSMDLMQKEGLQDYDAYVKVAFANSQKAGEAAPGPEVVARSVFAAANDNTFRLRYVAGNGQTRLVMLLRKVLPLRAFTKIVSRIVEKGFNPAKHANPAF